ncbi:MAG: hypothetical protein HZA32_00605 [Opitutae bacterium]|nr:hypothetical protein [Opitutae bacterium]
MKTKLTTLALALVTLFALATPQTAKANDTGAAIGGFIGGVIVGSVLADNHRGPDTVVVEAGYRDGYRCEAPRGYWRDVHTRVWVPGFWTMERDHWGRPYRRYVEGHYEVRAERVWIAYNDHGYHNNRGYRRW